MKTKNFIEKVLPKEISEMEIVGYLVFPTRVCIEFGHRIHSEEESRQDDDLIFNINIGHLDDADLWFLVENVYNGLFEKIIEKSGKSLSNEIESTIVLFDKKRNKQWFFYRGSTEYRFTDHNYIRQGWGLEYDPLNRQDKKNPFKNIWF